MYELYVDENSFAVSSTGVAMQVLFSGGTNCSSLTTTGTLTQNSGSISLLISPTVTGGYENCTIYTYDHAGLLSNEAWIGSFAYGTDYDDWCDHPSVTVPASECRALFAFYSGTL